MLNESWSEAVDKVVWEKEGELVLYSVILIFTEWVINPSPAMKPTPALQLETFTGSKDVKNNPTPLSYSPNIAVGVNTSKSSLSELQHKQSVL